MIPASVGSPLIIPGSALAIIGVERRYPRLQHRSPLLWRIHEAHHSVEDIDWVAGSRSHALEIREGGINFATKFAALDWIFGTARLPAVKPSGYGIDDPGYPQNYIARLFYALRRTRI
jgi:sterol desaturase/sphingolipid hydroxylase (fatty acid hydroxylase superfamily)